MVSNQRTFFDIGVEGKPIGRIVFELFTEQCPKTVENFRCLCTGERGGRLNYKGIKIHRIVKNFMLQGGDILSGNGCGPSISIFGGAFDDENFTLKHDCPYLLSMANRGPNSNGSQFFITTQVAPHLDGKHVVFGKVIKGQDVVQTIENAETDSNDNPYARITILKCGELVRKAKLDTGEDENSIPVEKKKTKKSKEDKKKKEKKKKEENNTKLVEKEKLSTENRKEAVKIPKVRISKSGRILKGRGQFRYRTPSPKSSYSSSSSRRLESRRRYDERREEHHRRKEKSPRRSLHRKSTHCVSVESSKSPDEKNNDKIKTLLV